MQGDLSDAKSLRAFSDRRLEPANAEQLLSERIPARESTRSLMNTPGSLHALELPAASALSDQRDAMSRSMLKLQTGQLHFAGSKARAASWHLAGIRYPSSPVSPIMKAT
jgi:hypothetical protein